MRQLACLELVYPLQTDQTWMQVMVSRHAEAPESTLVVERGIEACLSAHTFS